MTLTPQDGGGVAAVAAGTWLNHHLAAIYAERVLQRTAAHSAQAALAAALAEDAALRQAAEARLQALQQIPEQRCFVSARQRDFLAAALAATEHP